MLFTELGKFKISDYAVEPQYLQERTLDEICFLLFKKRRYTNR